MILSLIHFFSKLVYNFPFDFGQVDKWINIRLLKQHTFD